MTIFTLENSRGMEAKITPFGAILLSLRVPDPMGRSADVVLGYDTVEEYRRENRFYFGCVVGRCAGRISGGSFRLDGETYDLARNAEPNHLHGGRNGFDRGVWDVDRARSEVGRCISFTRLSRDGEEGYPGNVSVRVTYSLTGEGELRIDYEATTDRPTIVNLTHHSYFNLTGEGDVLKHFLTIPADRFLPMSRGYVPTGEMVPVAGTPFDFRSPVRIGGRIGRKDDQLVLARGYDHTFLLNREEEGLSPAATVYEPSTGRRMEVLTTEPGVHLYTGNFLEGRGKGGRMYRPRSGFCLETQHFPDSPNQKKFPSIVLRPEAKYESTTVYRFSAE